MRYISITYFSVTEDNNKSSSLSCTSRIDPELESRVTRATRRICENLHIIANEPSLALYRISEHVRKVNGSINKTSSNNFDLVAPMTNLYLYGPYQFIRMYVHFKH